MVPKGGEKSPWEIPTSHLIIGPPRIRTLKGPPLLKLRTFGRRKGERRGKNLKTRVPPMGKKGLNERQIP